MLSYFMLYFFLYYIIIYITYIYNSYIYYTIYILYHIYIIIYILDSKLAASPNLQVSLTLRSRTAAGYFSKIALNPNRQGRHDQQA
jgi:hypothetical protein